MAIALISSFPEHSIRREDFPHLAIPEETFQQTKEVL